MGFLIKKTITDNNTEELEISWDGERFGLTHIYKKPLNSLDYCKIIVLNIAEAGQLIDFIKEQIKHG